MARVELEGVTRQAGGARILDQVSFDVGAGELVTLVGSSGSGKTSVIRAVAGFDELTSGVVRFDGVDVTATPTRDRDVGLVSQGRSLFPHYRVSGNLSFPLWNRAVSRAEARKRVEAESRAQAIDHLLDRWPASLAGGEQRLVQIARALVRVPEVMLMDEPLAELDPPVRSRLRHELVELQRGYGVTMLYATNRSDEILTMPDRLVALDRGRVVQIGAPRDVRRRPATLAIAELTGALSRLDVTVEADSGGYWLTGDGVRLRAWAPALAGHVGWPVTLAARSDDVRVAPGGPIAAVAGPITLAGSRSVRELRCGAGSLHTHDTGLAPDARVSVTLDRWLLFDEGGRRIHSFPD